MNDAPLSHLARRAAAILAALWCSLLTTLAVALGCGKLDVAFLGRSSDLAHGVPALMHREERFMRRRSFRPALGCSPAFSACTVAH